jgi:hypothetical protein
MDGFDTSGFPRVVVAETDEDGQPVLNTSSGHCFLPTDQEVLLDPATRKVFPEFEPQTTGSTCAELVFGPADETPPICEIVAIRNGPPKQIDVRVQDTGVGLAQIEILTQDNATVSVPGFALGTIDPVVVTATKIDQSQGSRIEIEATDFAGNRTVCDPVLAVLQIAPGRNRVRATFSEIPMAERFVTIQNGSPGLARVQVIVNGRQAANLQLRRNEAWTVNVGSLMMASQNTVTLVAVGRPGSSAVVLISDAPGAAAKSVTWEPGSWQPNQNLQWGSTLNGPDPKEP